jgi:hypothetical protein
MCNARQGGDRDGARGEDGQLVVGQGEQAVGLPEQRRDVGGQ